MIRSSLKLSIKVNQIQNIINQADYIQFSGKAQNSYQHQNYNANLFFKLNYAFFKQSVTIDYKKNYYQILNVNQTAELAEIKKSFYKLAKQSHPDTSKGNQQQFKIINQAYNVLSHQQRRKQYNVHRVRAQQPQNPNDEVKSSSTNDKSKKTDQTYSNYQQYKKTEQYENDTKDAYYHYSRGQWQQFRSGYKYHISPKAQYYKNMTNNLSSEKLYQNMKRMHNKKTVQEDTFLDEMQRYFEYVQKLKDKENHNKQDYERKIQQLQRQFYEKKKEAFRRTWIGRGYYGIMNLMSRIKQKLGKQRKGQATQESK